MTVLLGNRQKQEFRFGRLGSRHEHGKTQNMLCMQKLNVEHPIRHLKSCCHGGEDRGQGGERKINVMI